MSKQETCTTTLGWIGAQPCSARTALKPRTSSRYSSQLFWLVISMPSPAFAVIGSVCGLVQATRIRANEILRVARTRPDRRLGDVVELAVVREPLLGQRLAHDLERLGEAVARLVHRAAVGIELALGGAAPEAERQTAALQQVVEHADLLGDHDRVVPGQHDHHRAEVDAAGLAGEVGQVLKGAGRS